MDFYSHKLAYMNYKGSKLSNFQLNTYIDQDNRPLPLGEQNTIVDEYVQFVKERNQSTCYRLSGVLRGLFSNVLFNITGEKSYETILSLKDNAGKFNPNPQYRIFQNFGYKDILLEKDGWFFYRENTAGTLKGCVDIFLRPVPNDMYFLPRPLSGLTMLDPNGNPRENWYFKITYPKYTSCTISFQSPFVSGSLGLVSICDGIVVENITGGTLNGRSYTYIETKIKHGLLSGDRIILRPVNGIITQKVFNVISVDSDYKFWIDYYDDDYFNNVINNSTLTANPIRFKRYVQGIESQYFVRNFEAITTLNDYQEYPAGFSNNIFNDPIELYHFQKDIDTSPYTDYLNRPLTELYLTKIKYKNPNKFISDMETWTDLAVGLLYGNDLYRCDDYSIKSIYGGSPLVPFPTHPMIVETVDENTNIFFGDIVDYNIGDITERVLEEAYYRFNTTNREDNCYYEGYYYKAHDKIKLLDYSSQVEQENLSLPDVGIPSYAVSIEGVMQWRDLLTPGFIDAGGNGVDYPFLNGCTYIFSEHDMCLKRQNPKQLSSCTQCSIVTVIPPPRPSGTTRPTTQLQPVGFFCYANCGAHQCGTNGGMCNSQQISNDPLCSGGIGFVGCGRWQGCSPTNKNRDVAYIVPGQDPRTNPGYFFYTAWGTPLTYGQMAGPLVIGIPNATYPGSWPNNVMQSTYYLFDINTSTYEDLGSPSFPGVCDCRLCPPPQI